MKTHTVFQTDCLEFQFVMDMDLMDLKRDPGSGSTPAG